MLDKFVSIMGLQNATERQERLRRQLMRHEARIGGELFGKVSQGRRRDFFCLDSHTWIWYEEWTDKNQVLRSVTTRYEIRHDGSIIKIRDGKKYQKISDREMIRLVDAMKAYESKVVTQLYSPALQSQSIK